MTAAFVGSNPTNPAQALACMYLDNLIQRKEFEMQGAVVVLMFFVIFLGILVPK